MPSRRKPQPGQLALPILPVSSPFTIVAVEAPWTIAPADAALGNLAHYAQGQVFQHAGGFSLFFYRERGQWAVYHNGGPAYHVEPLVDEFDPTQPPFDYAVVIAHARQWVTPYPHYAQALRGAPTKAEEET